MLGVGEQRPSFSLTATVSTEKGKTFKTIPTRIMPVGGKLSFSDPKTSLSCAPSRSRPSARWTRSSRGATRNCSAAAWIQSLSTWRGARTTPISIACPARCRLTFAATSAACWESWTCKKASPSEPPSSSTRRNTIRFVSVNDLSVGRNPQEVLRVLDALQAGDLTPCNWHPGLAVLQPAS
jgi:lipoyl-dependent peroxiredoxin subunit C